MMIVGAVHRRRELGRHELERREPLGQAFDIEPAALAHSCDARPIAIVQAEAIAEQSQVGHERDAAQARADDRHGGRLRRLVRARQSTTFGWSIGVPTTSGLVGGTACAPPAIVRFHAYCVAVPVPRG
jgi:hypothetical protein